MPLDGGVSWGAVFKFVAAPAVALGKAVFGRTRRFADAELAELRQQLNELCRCVEEGAVAAQVAVRGNPNTLAAQESHGLATKLATQAGQKLACLVGTDAMAHGLPPRLVDARTEFRITVTEDANLDMVDPAEREVACAAIESAAASFHREVRDYSMKRWSIGIGANAGRETGRKFPK